MSEGFRSIQRDEGQHVSFGLQLLRYYAHKDKRYARRILEMDEEVPAPHSRALQPIVIDGGEYDLPFEERGVERLMALYQRRHHDIFV